MLRAGVKHRGLQYKHRKQSPLLHASLQRSAPGGKAGEHYAYAMRKHATLRATNLARVTPAPCPPATRVRCGHATHGSSLLNASCTK